MRFVLFVAITATIIIVSHGEDHFDWSLTKASLTKIESNTIFSPFLAKVVIALLVEAGGPGTHTQRELASAWPEAESLGVIRDLYQRSFESLSTLNDNYEMNFGVRMYVDNFINPLMRFKAIAKSFYQVDVERIPFSQTTASASYINSWVRDVTKNCINEIVRADELEEAVIVLLNAMYFHGEWVNPFDLARTAVGPFKLNYGARVEAAFMDTTSKFDVANDASLDASIIRLPYKGNKYSMYILLPNRDDGLNDLLRNIDGYSLRRIRSQMERMDVHLRLPKFKFNNDIHMKEILKELGIRSIFTKQASFPLLARGASVQDRLEISQILQKAGIDVDERGSTAYAATQVSLIDKFGGEQEFIVDHPFFFLIEDETTDTILFTGKVIDPKHFGTHLQKK